MNRAAQALVLREVGRAHAWGQYLYEVVLSGKVVAKICATPADANTMAKALENKQ